MAWKLWRLAALLTVLLAVTGKSAETRIPTPYLQESSETYVYNSATNLAKILYNIIENLIYCKSILVYYVRVNWSREDL